MSRTRFSLATPHQPKSKLLVRQLRLVHMYCLSPRMLLCRDRTNPQFRFTVAMRRRQTSFIRSRSHSPQGLHLGGFGGSGYVSPELGKVAFDLYGCVVRRRRRLPHCRLTLPPHTPHCEFTLPAHTPQCLPAHTKPSPRTGSARQTAMNLLRGGRRLKLLRFQSLASMFRGDA